jgi:hypothetical protein
MIEEQQMRAWAPALAPLFARWRERYDRGELRDWEFAAHYFFLFVFLQRPQEKWSQQKLLTSLNSPNLVPLAADVQEFLGSEGLGSPREDWGRGASWVYGDMRSLRGIPDKVLQSLRGWRQGTHALHLRFDIPSAPALLRQQVQGQRCVSVLISKEELEAPVETGRDAWSFCLHDLLHASHFFAEPKYHRAQRYLSHFFLQAWEQSPLGPWLLADPEFSSEFIYVAADMNAHPVYILASFYAKVLAHFKRMNGFVVTEPLAPEAEAHWRGFWVDFLRELPVAIKLRQSLELFLQPRLTPEVMLDIEKTLLQTADVYFSAEAATGAAPPAFES